MAECGEGVDALALGVGVEGVDDAPVDEGGFEVVEVGGTEVADELMLDFEALDVSLVEHADGGGDDDVVEGDLLPVIGHGGSSPCGGVGSERCFPGCCGEGWMGCADERMADALVEDDAVVEFGEGRYLEGVDEVGGHVVKCG